MGKGDKQPAAKAKKTSDQKVRDATFGARNQKGAAFQKKVAQLKKSADAGDSKSEQGKAKAAREALAAEKIAKEEARREMEILLNKPAPQIQKVPFGVDPKTVVCNFFRKGDCQKGNKCKFSHDLDMDRKTDKRDLYVDGRGAEEEKKKTETSDDWTEEQLRSVVLSKKGNQRTTTDKVCKYFISAIEDGKYGWFWVCPNGGDSCKYKHALPEGFVIKTKEQRAAEKALLDKSPLKTLTLEEFLESERHKLQGPFTPVNEETFAKWKKERMDKKAAEEQLRKAKEATGRALFESGNWRTVDGSDDEGGDDDDDDGVWNLEKMRKETEMLQAKKEEERLAALHGGPVDPSVYGGTAVPEPEPEPDGDGAGEDGSKA